MAEQQPSTELPRKARRGTAVWDLEGRMSDLPRKAVTRTAKLAALPLGFAGRATWGLGKRIGGKSAEIVGRELQQRTAEQLFKVLGELKGGAMKFGQALSVFESALPEEVAGPYRAALTKLQEAAPADADPHGARGAGGAARRGLAGAVPGVRGQAGRRGLDRPGAPGGVARRPRGRGQGAVPGRRARRCSPTSTNSAVSPGCWAR